MKYSMIEYLIVQLLEEMHDKDEDCNVIGFEQRLLKSDGCKLDKEHLSSMHINNISGIKQKTYEDMLAFNSSRNVICKKDSSSAA